MWKILIHYITLIFQMLTHFIIKYQKSHSLMSHKSYHKSLQVLQTCQGYDSRYKFSKVIISHENLKQILSVVFLEVIVSFHSILRTCLPITQVCITIICQSFFQVKMVLREKSQICSQLKQYHKSFSLK